MNCILTRITSVLEKWVSVALLIVGLGSTVAVPQAMAVQLDWNGQFWLDNQWINNYQLSRSRPGYDADPVLSTNGGAYVPGTGEKNSIWYSAFLKLKPRLVVNDSVNIKSELHIGSPIYGFLGRNYPSTGDERFNFAGAQKDNAVVGAQRFWANLITDFGTIEIGRAPIHWGLGAIWNSGDNLFDRYQSTGDMVRLTSKFGNFSVQPSLVKRAVGTNVSGASVNGVLVQGNDDVTDYNLAAKYDNSEEDFEFGVMWTRRTGNTAQQTIFFNPALTGSTRINFNLFDFYAHKKLGHFTLGGELPLYNGSLGAADGQNEFDYKTVAVVAEGQYTSDLWDILLKLGHVPGQPSIQSGDNKYRAVYLNKDYKLGLIMFNYNIYGLTNNNPDNVSPGTLRSPYDNEIVNANYFALTPEVKLDKWTVKSTFVFAYADQTAQSGKQLYNHPQRRFYPAVDNQASFLGKEVDLGVSFKWDENFVLGWDFGVWFPGGFYQFANVAGGLNPPLDNNFMFASQVRAGITF